MMGFIKNRFLLIQCFCLCVLTVKGLQKYWYFIYKSDIL